MPLPPMVLDAPAAPQSPPGLLDAATGPLAMPDHLMTSGGIYVPDSCGDVHQYPAPCATPPYPTIELDTVDPSTTVYSFNLYASEVCGTFGQNEDEAERRVRARLALNEQRGVERALWGGADGEAGIFELLNDASKLTVLGDSASMVEAISLLEQQGADSYGGRIIIHARPRMAAYAGGVATPAPDVTVPKTKIGNPVVFGYGYQGTGPDEEAIDATTEWVYGTGRIIIWRSDVWVSPPDQMINRTTNQRGLFAMRSYALAVECFAAATQTTRA